MAHAGKTFYRAAALLPKGVRAEVMSLYVFCREVDDLADEPGMPIPQRRLALDMLSDAFAQGDLPHLKALGWNFSTQGTMPAAARLLVKAAAQDLEQQQPHSSEELLSYAFGVAGTVGIMMAHVLGAKAEGLQAAVSLGMAMQLSNIARDVAEDLQNGRVYLPADYVSAQEIRAALAQSAHVDTSSARVVLAATAHTLTLAESLYQAAFLGICTLPWRMRWSILAAALCYREIGRKVGRQGSRSWSYRVVVSGRRKWWLIAVAGLRLSLPHFLLIRRRCSPSGLNLIVAENLLRLETT